MHSREIVSKYYTYNSLCLEEKEHLLNNLKQVKLWDSIYQNYIIVICEALTYKRYDSVYRDYERKALNPQNLEDKKLRNIFYNLTGSEMYSLADYV